MVTASILPPIDKLNGADDYSDWKLYNEHSHAWSMKICGSLWHGQQAITNNSNMTKTKAKLILAIDKSNYTHIRNAPCLKKFEDHVSGLIKKLVY